jgi:hypothetical protein
MFGMESSENFYFATKSKTLNEGLEQQLNSFVKEHTDAMNLCQYFGHKKLNFFLPA